jgi:integrase
VTIGPRFGIMTKNSKEREIEIPSALMNNLYQYSISARYIKRRDKFITKAEEKSPIPLFLNNRGGSFSATTVNGRWGEIRNALALRIGQAFDHKVHNLRSTYAVERLKALLNAGMQQGDALSFIQSKLGHSDLTTTLHYLKQAEGRDEAFKWAEVALDHLFNIDGSDFEVAQ